MAYQIYFHGTCSARAVQALLGGEPLMPRRPLGDSDFVPSRPGLRHVTPCFRHAAEYAVMTNRADWPQEHDVEVSSRAWIFAFELDAPEDGRNRLDEDELGWAIKHAIVVASGQTDAGWITNTEFADNFESSRDTMTRLADLALPELSRRQAFQRALQKPLLWNPRLQTKAALLLESILPEELRLGLVNLGISLGIPEPIWPTAAWNFAFRDFPRMWEGPPVPPDWERSCPPEGMAPR